MNLIPYANIIISRSGAVMVAVPENSLAEQVTVDLCLSVADNSLDIRQDGILFGHIEETPGEALKSLSTARQILLIEIGPGGPVRIHGKVSVRACDT